MWIESLQTAGQCGICVSFGAVNGAAGTLGPYDAPTARNVRGAVLWDPLILVTRRRVR